METKKGERKPKCALCRIHGVVTPLKGHKRICPRLRCKCEFCDLVDRRRKVMAAQIKLRRTQVKEDQARQNEINSKTSDTGEMTSKTSDTGETKIFSFTVHEAIRIMGW